MPRERSCARVLQPSLSPGLRGPDAALGLGLAWLGPVSERLSYKGGTYTGPRKLYIFRRIGWRGDGDHTSDGSPLRSPRRRRRGEGEREPR